MNHAYNHVSLLGLQVSQYEPKSMNDIKFVIKGCDPLSQPLASI